MANVVPDGRYREAGPALVRVYEFRTLRRMYYGRLYPLPLNELELPSVVVFDDHDKICYQVFQWRGMEKYKFCADGDELEDSLNKFYSNSRYDIH